VLWFHVVQYKGVSEKSTASTFAAEVSHAGKAVCYTETGERRLWNTGMVTLSHKQGKGSRCPDGPTRTGPERGKFSRPEATAQTILWQAKKRQVHALLQQGWRRTLTTWIQVSTFSQQDGWRTHFSAIWCDITGYSVPHILRHQSGLTFKSQMTKKDAQEQVDAWIHIRCDPWVLRQLL